MEGARGPGVARHPRARAGRWSGVRLPELAVVLEQSGRSLVPGPLLPTVVAAAVVVESGTDAQRAELVPSLIDGSETAALSFGTGRLEIIGRAAGRLPRGHR